MSFEHDASQGGGTEGDVSSSHDDSHDDFMTQLASIPAANLDPREVCQERALSIKEQAKALEKERSKLIDLHAKMIINGASGAEYKEAADKIMLRIKDVEARCCC